MNMKQFREELLKRVENRISYFYVQDKVKGRVAYYKSGAMGIEDKETNKLKEVSSNVVDEAMKNYSSFDLDEEATKKIENNPSFDINFKRVLENNVKYRMPVYQEEECFSTSTIFTSTNKIILNKGTVTEISDKDIFVSRTNASYTPEDREVPYIIWSYFKRVLGDTDYRGQVIEASDERVECMLDFLAIMTTPSIALKKVVFLLGETNTGKSTFMRFFGHMLGDLFNSLPVTGIMDKKYGDPQIQPGLIRVRNCNTAYGAEPEENFVFSDSLTKAITGSDRLSLRNPHGTNITFTPHCTICITANYFPRLKNSSDTALWSRFAICEFKNGFTDDEIDPQFYDKLIDPSVMNPFFTHLVDRAFKYYQNGEKITIHESFVKGLEFYKFHQRGSFENFIDDQCIVTGNYNMVTKADEIFERYVSYCSYHGIEPMRKAKFFKELKHFADITPGVEKVKTKQVPSSYRGLEVNQIPVYQYQQFVMMHSKKQAEDNGLIGYGGNGQSIGLDIYGNSNNQSITPSPKTPAKRRKIFER